MENHFIYDYRTITRLLKKVYNLVVNCQKVYRIMKEKGCLCCVRPKKGPKLGKPYHLTDNKLDRDFQADKTMEKLVTDITYLYFGNCRLYLSSIMISIIAKLQLIPSPIAKIITLCSIHFINLNYLKERFYTATRDLFTPQNPTIRLAQKKASPAPCPEKEHQQIMPVLNGFMLSSSLKPSISIIGET